MIVADGRCRAERFLHIASVEQTALGGGLRPDPREAIGLKLQPHGQFVLSRWVLPLDLTDLALHAQKVLDMMADLMRQHVGLREIARRSEAAAEFIIKAQVNVSS